MILFRLRDSVDKVLREEQYGFRKLRGWVNQIFTLRLIIEKCLSYQIPLVLSFIDYEQAFASPDKRALVKVLSLCSIPLYMDHFDGFVLRSTGKLMGDHGIKWGGKNLLDLDYADDLSILDQNVMQNE